MAEFDEASAQLLGPDGKPAPTFDEASAKFVDPPSGVIRRTIGDAATGLGQGLVALPQAALGLADLVTGGAADRVGGALRRAGDTVANVIGDAVTGKTIGKDFGVTGDLPSQGMAQTAEAIGQYYSPEAKASLAAQQARADEFAKAGKEKAGVPGQIAGGFAGAIAGMAENPGSILPVVAQSVPSMLAPIGVNGKAVDIVGQRALLAAKAAGATPEVAIAAARAAAEKFVEGKAGIATAALAEGAVGGGQNAAQAKADVMSMPEEKLAGMKPYQDLLASGMAPAAARLKLAESAESTAAAVSGALSTLAGPIAGRFEARAGARLAGGELAKGVQLAGGVKAGLRNAAAEAGQETLQSAGEQFGQNVGMRTVDPNQDLAAQVGEQAGAGAVAGLAMGGGVHLLTSGPIGKAAAAGGVAPEQKLLPAPGQIPIQAGDGDFSDPGRMLEAEQKAQELYAARAKVEAEKAAFASNGVISAAAVGAINTGATEQAQAKREAAIAETLNPAQPLALPAPVAEKEKLEQQKVDEYLAGKDSTSLTDAQRKSFEGEARGHSLVVVPHPSGKGYTTIPASKLSDRQQRAVESIQRPDQGQLPSPRDEMPGAWIAPEGRTPEPRTYGDNNAGMLAEMGRWRTAMGTPVPKQMPIDNEKRAAQIAERKTQETGREHTVVAHPMSATKFAVAPVPTTIDAKAERVQDSAAFTGREQSTGSEQSTQRGQPAGVNNASQEAAVSQPQSAGVANDQADGAGAPAVAGPSPAAEAPQAEGVAPAPTGNGFVAAPDGYRVRVDRHRKGSNVLDPEADAGAFVYEVRKGEGDTNPLVMVLNKDGKLVAKKEVLNGNDSNGTAWIPPSEGAAAAVGALLSERAQTEVGSPERKAVDAKLREAVTGAVSPAAEIEALARDAATSPENDRSHPSAAQSEVGNYKKVRVPPRLLHGLEVTIENPAGSVRVAKDGSWASAMPNHYGYIRRTEGNDGDYVDTFIGPKPESKQVFIVDQMNPKTGEFDEHKVMLGFDSQEAAEAGYRAAYPADWKGMGTVTATTVDGLKEWVKTGNTKAPYADLSSGRAVADMKRESSGFSSTSVDYAARPVTTADPKSLKRSAHLFGQPAARVVDIDGGHQATEEEARAIAAIVGEAHRLGLPEAAEVGLRPIAVLDGSHNGMYWFENATIALTRDDLLLAADGNKWASITNVGKYVHEVMHHITGDENGNSFASKSPAFAISRNIKGERVASGPVIKEAFDAWAGGNNELRGYLNYPFKLWGDKLLSREHTLVLQDEVMAQLGRIYYTNPRLLRMEFPKAFAMMEGLHNEVAVGGGIDETRGRVREYLRTLGAKVGDRVDAGKGSGRADQESSGGGQAGAGLGGRASREPTGSRVAEVPEAGGHQGGRGLPGQGGRAGRGDARLAAAPQAGTASGQAQRLTGAPEGYEPSARAQQAAREYMKSAGLPYSPPTEYVKVDRARAERIAQAYADMKHEPGSMPVKAAYAKMIRETIAQWKAIEKTGLKVTFATAENPYPYTVPGEVFPDVNENNHMWVFPTLEGFGSDASVDVSDNPLLEDTGIVIGGHKLVANDVFRIVHDYFGHIKNGVGFRANGEENAWRAHSAMFSPLARRAMTSETRGQNSWLNWGPHGEKNRTAKTEDTIFADQKTGLLPEWVSEDNYAKRPGALEVRDVTQTPEFKKWFGDSKVVDANGKPLRVYHGTPSDFSTFSPTELEDDEGGIYFTTSARVAGEYAHKVVDGGAPNVVPVYLRISNPYRSTAEEWTNAEGLSLQEAQADGFDGYLIDGQHGYETWIAFEPTQIKSAVGNNGNFDAKRPSILEVKDDGAAATITIGVRPGMYGWNFAQADKTAPPVALPTAKGPRIEAVAPKINDILSAPGVRKIIADLYGVKNVKVSLIFGTWEGVAEPSYVLTGKGMTFEKASEISKLLGFAFAQDAAIASEVSPTGDGIPSTYIGSKSQLTEKQKDAVLEESIKEGLDLSSSPDGKGVAYLYFGDPEGLPDFHAKVAKIAAAVGLKERYDFAMRSDLNEAQGYTKGSSGEQRGATWLHSAAGGPSATFKRVVDHLVVPYARAVGAEGYRFSPERFAARFGLTPSEEQVVREALLPRGGVARSTAGLVYGSETLPIEGTGKRGRSTVLDVMWALQNRAAQTGLIEPGDHSGRAKLIIASTIADEVSQHIANSGKSAIGWYDRALKLAKKIWGSVFPEIAGDPNKEMVFDAVLGITSQGNSVDENAVFAARVFDNYRRTGVLSTAGLDGSFGEQTRAIEGNIEKLKTLIDRNGFDRLRKLMNTRRTVGEWNAILRHDEKLFAPDGTPLQIEGAARQRVTGWFVFGPKIGSFINNLHGDYSTLTADLWFTRTWNRILGYSFAHVPESEADSYARFQEELLNEVAFGKQSEDTEGLLPNDVIGDPEAMIEVARAAYDKFVSSGFKDKSPLRRAAKGWIERRENPLAAPRSANERAFQQDTVEAAQKMIKSKTGVDITIADIQAALWYHEKELFKKLGAGSKKSAPADYADAAQALVDRYNAGDLYFVKSTGANLLGEKGFYLSAKRPSILEVRDNEPLWYSQLATAVESKAPFAKDGTIPAGQLRMWLAARSKDGGVKAEELKWSGIDDWLALAQDAPDPKYQRVSRDDVKSFLDQNGVKITETTLGEAQPPTGWVLLSPNDEVGIQRWSFGNGTVKGYGDTAQEAIIDAQMKLEREAKRWLINGDEEKGQRLFAQADEFASYMEARAGVGPNGGETTKFSSYQLPGGENYRELLLTLPSKKAPVEYQFSVEQGARRSELLAKGRLTDAEARELGDLNRAHQLRHDEWSRPVDRGAFRSSHFDQPNILAHIRFNERTDAEGKRVLFIEEIQSDWAQKGRKERATSPDLLARADDGKPMYSTPSAPFVGKTEAWVALALKRMIRYAADNGFDRVEWTTGEQQAERYDLSKQVRSIDYAKTSGGDYTLKLMTTEGAFHTMEVKAADLEETVGKEAAKKIVDNVGREVGAPEGSGILRGVDLKVGGEGMRAFYDKIVPNVANDLLKKMGGGRVGQFDLRSGGILRNNVQNSGNWAGKQPGFDITPDMAPAARRPQAMFVNTATVTNAVQDLLTTSRSFNLWDRTVGTQLNKALKNPMFAKVYNGVQSFLNDSSQMMMEAADLAPDLLPKLDGFGDIFKRGPSKADLANVSSAVFDGTINDVVYSDAELRTRGLDDKQIGLYRQARAAIDKSLSDAVASEAVKQAKGLLPQSVLDQAKAAGDAWIVVNALSALRTRSAVQQQVYDQLRARAAEVSDLQTKGYAPLQRFGQYTVHVTNPDGSSALFTMHEKEREANAFARAAQASLQPGQTLTQGVMSQEAWKLFQGVSPDTLQIFAESIGASQSQVMQSYIKLAANNRSVLKRMLQRKEIAGFQTDIQRTLAQFITSNARAAAKNYHWGEVLKATNDIPKELGDVKDEAVRLKEYMETAKEEAGALRGLLFIQFLGGSIASAFTNATQPVMMTFPWLSQFGGAAKAAAQLTRAGKIALAPSSAMEPALRAAMDRATKEGIVAPHEVAGLYAESIRNFGSNMAVRRGLKVWGSLFSLAEGFNRRITFVAAYRTAVEQNMADPYEFATRAIAETQGVYNRGNRPNWARGAVGATLFTFKQYSVAYVEMLNRLPAKQKAVALAVLVLASGLQGLPGADDLEDVIDTIAESLGYSFNSKKQLREWAARTLGDTAGGLLTHGFSALPGVPIDVQARLGLGNLIPGTALLKRSETDKSRDVMEFFGPAGSQAQSFVDAFSAAQEGNAAEFFKAGIPLAMKNALKGLDMAQSGFYKDMRGRRVIDVDTYDALMKGIGFQPQRVAKQTRVVQDMQQDINLAKDVEASLVERMARGIVEHDPEALQKARVELFLWNQRNPEARIGIKPSQVQQRVKQMNMTREQRFVKTAPQEMRQHVREELRQ